MLKNRGTFEEVPRAHPLLRSLVAFSPRVTPTRLTNWQHLAYRRPERNNLLIPDPDWRSNLTLFPKELALWAASRPEASFNDLWDKVIDPTWLPHLAIAGGATWQQLNIAVCHVVRLCLHMVPELKDLPRSSIETFEMWCSGASVDQENKAMGSSAAAYYVYYDPTHPTRPYTTTSLSYLAPISDVYYTYYTIQSGIGSQLVCSTMRECLPFERPKGLTIWQRLAAGGDE